MNPTKTTEQFILEAKQAHGDKYDYSLSEYINGHTKIKIICPRHGVFWQEASSHLRGCGCKKCAVFGGTKRKLTTEQFIERAKQIHGDEYDYSKVNYIDKTTKICIICRKHGEFWQRPSDHLDGYGCLECARESRKLTTEEFIKRAQEIHGNKYDYSKVNYIDNKTKVCVICPKHGEFWQTPGNHIGNKQECPECARTESHGEREIKRILEEFQVDFQQEKIFDGCIAKRKLPFDFFLPKQNIVIEFQGEQHFKPIKKFGGLEKFLERQEHDRIKRKFCLDNNIKEIEIPYTEYNKIMKILEPYLQKGNDAE